MILGSSVWCSKFYLPCMGRGTGVYMQDVHVHAGTEEGAVSLGPGPMEILLDGMRLSENPCQHNHDLSYYFDHTESDLVSINPIGEIKFSIGDGDEVRHNKTSIDSLYSCTDEQRRRPLTWGGWSWVCGVLWFRCSHRGRGTSQGCS